MTKELNCKNFKEKHDFVLNQTQKIPFLWQLKNQKLN